MSTIRRRGGLFVASAAVCAVLLATTTVLQVEAESAVASLRGGQRTLISTDGNNQYYKPIYSRGLEGGEGEGNGEQQGQQQGEQQQGEQKEQEGEQQEEQQQQQYQEAQEDNDNNQQEAQEEQQQQQEEEEVEEWNDDNNQNYNVNMNDDGNADGEQNNMYNNVQNTVSNAQDQVQSLMDRVDEDFVMMWSTSPSEWDEECWKVFGIFAGVFTLLLSCTLYLFCLCCSGEPNKSDRETDLLPKSDAEALANAKRRSHRGRLFARSRTGDTDTVGTGHASQDDWERPYLLVDDVENNDTNTNFTGASTNNLTSPVYERGRSDDRREGISPLSSKTENKMTELSTRALASPPNGEKGPAETFDDGETLTSKQTFQSAELSRAPRKESSGGILSETLDVWSEFLGIKKSKYTINSNASAITKIEDEDDDIVLTDDEMMRRKKRSSSRNSRNSKKKEPAPAQMKTGTYSRPEEESTAGSKDPEAAGSSKNNSNGDKVGAETPVMSNNSTPARRPPPNSPRRTALIKTKNLLRSIGGNGNKNKGKSKNNSNHSRKDSKSNSNHSKKDPKEEVLLNSEAYDARSA